ncbi:MAG TPA: caspase family protein, partial [Caldilineae bacterium]|nr:caspase family protein [Caldilineae bacterium]
MTRTVYALLVGIDDYPAPVNPLKGCVNDIERMHTLLQERIVGDGDEYKPLLLTNGAATRQGVIDGFHNHLAQAGEHDVALFCYSGHGSQQKSPPEFWDLEPDRRDETLVCYDSRSTGSW